MLIDEDIAEQFSESIILDYQVRGNKSVCDIPLRLQAKYWGHFPRYISSIKATGKALKKV